MQNEERWRFEQVFSQYQRLGDLQVQADTVYFNRTSVITLAQGLLLLVVQALISSHSSSVAIVAIALIGFILSLFWFLFEQRNELYFNGRGVVVERYETQVRAMASELGFDLPPFWTEVPAWVHANATKWYQKRSAPRIQRMYVPILFMVLWTGLLILVPLGVLGTANKDSQVCLLSRDGKLLDCDLVTPSKSP